MGRFQVPLEERSAFQAEGEAIHWALGEALAASPFAVQIDWKHGPTELILGFKECLETCSEFRSLRVKLEIGSGEPDAPFDIRLSMVGKPPAHYRWTQTDRSNSREIAFSFAELLPQDIAVFSVRSFEETDQSVYLIAPKRIWSSVRDLLHGRFDEFFASHEPGHSFQAVGKKTVRGRRTDWRKLWDIYAGPARHGTLEDVNRSLDILRPLNSANMFYGPGKALRTHGISFFLHEILGRPFDRWCVDRNPEHLLTTLYSYASAARIGAYWNLHALRAFPSRKLWGHCLGYGYLIWAYFIYAALGSSEEAQECGRLLELETVRNKERGALFRNQESYYDLVLYLHRGTRTEKLNALEPIMMMEQRKSWEDNSQFVAALKTHCQTRGEQFVHDSIRWTWPATLYASARRAGALDLLPRDNPFSDTPLDISQVDCSHPWLQCFATLEDRYRVVDQSCLPPLR